jgi:hypothetical protein
LFYKCDVALDSGERVQLLLEKRKVDLPQIVVIAGEEVSCTALEGDVADPQMSM